MSAPCPKCGRPTERTECHPTSEPFHVRCKEHGWCYVLCIGEHILKRLLADAKESGYAHLGKLGESVWGDGGHVPHRSTLIVDANIVLRDAEHYYIEGLMEQ